MNFRFDGFIENPQAMLNLNAEQHAVFDRICQLVYQKLKPLESEINKQETDSSKQFVVICLDDDFWLSPIGYSKDLSDRISAAMTEEDFLNITPELREIVKEFRN